ncbi:12801_t:CDS:1, partial [Funneliformis geosporum]
QSRLVSVLDPKADNTIEYLNRLTSLTLESGMRASRMMEV